ncbi:hypothetical protein P7C70_g4110, partial [Phenoliferia sp. Uapishka_3]
PFKSKPTTAGKPAQPCATIKTKPTYTRRTKAKPKIADSDSDSPGFIFPDSSDSEPDHLRSSPPPPRASTSKTAPPKPTPTPAGMPDYSTFETAKLQTEVSKYGFRISKERSVLIEQLTQVWMAMHPPVPVAAPKATPKKPRAKAKAKSKKAAVGDEDDEDVGEEETVGERLRKAILGNEELYLKVLRYEPIFFDEIVNLAAENGIKSSKPLLMRCLDEQCVTFYTQDPTNGSRKRYR